MRPSICLSALLCICPLSAPLPAADALDFEEQTTRTNYSVGYQIGGDFKRQGVEINAEAVVQGIRDALSGNTPQLTPAEMNATLVELKNKIVSGQRQRSAETELEKQAAGEKFMRENAAAEGVVTTASGLQYKVIKAGAGKRPGASDEVTVHYRGTLINGNEFDSSFKRGKPSTFRLDSVIKGWSEGLQLMQEGGVYQLFVPPELAYGRRGPLAHRTLVFEVELLSVAPGETASPGQAPASTPEK
jgi:FKBP-type peptidyl-prolyl cis-trans isomerase FklB